MALHCAATLVLVPAGTPAPGLGLGPGGAGAVTAAPPDAGADVVEVLQSLADEHRGERVVVPLEPAQLAAVLAHLGRARWPGGPDRPVLLDIGDDGWVLHPAGR